MAIDYEIRQDGVAIVTMNRPETLNALDRADLKRLAEVFEDLKMNPQVLVAIISGAGDRAFTAGMDWNVLNELDPNKFAGHQQHAESPDGLMLNMVPFMKGIDIWKPLIAAVNGHCIALGACMLLGTDIRIASPNATFGLNETTFGVLASGGAIARLPRQIPFCHAMDILLTGRSITADEMLRFGLVNEIVPLPQLLPRALEVAEMLVTKCDKDAVQITKQCVIRGLDMGLRQALVEEALYTEMLNNRHGGTDVMREQHAARFRRT